ncbi:MAG: tRNA 2-thiouridine(34) synthase MnmA [Desulfitobacteriaceae bacterium]|nr:tRNA 2-thiouridine(34) synthase MnmA [Desulfitobacteriaceae bacterium]MDD4401307.1 tRNA 2-thiouridine(34) synthase MnmA [Desulfitobacteriaceae bacterium]
MNLINKKKVVVGISGGVDSCMAAALLKEQGYDVIGVTLQMLPEAADTEKFVSGGNSAVSAIDDARQAAGRLGISHYVINSRELFEEKVVNYFTEAYLAGQTPNPCLSCNRYLKFGNLLHKATGLGAGYIATGHYAQITQDSRSGRFLLRKGFDDQKDQTYVLYMLTQEQLAGILFPLGGFTKKMIREMARERGFSEVADKPDSQEICFVPDNDYASFIRRRVGRCCKKGNFVDLQGNVLGEHQGIIHYTVGQRKGLGISFGKPMYVIGLNPERREVILGEDKEVYSDTLWARDLNWISISQLKEPLPVEAKIRYKAQPSPAVIYPLKSSSEPDEKNYPAEVKVCFKIPQRAVTPGQAVVFYQGELVVGGGTIISGSCIRHR